MGPRNLAEWFGLVLLIVVLNVAVGGMYVLGTRLGGEYLGAAMAPLLPWLFMWLTVRRARARACSRRRGGVI